MDFLSKIFKPTKSGSGPSVGNKTPNPSLKSEHETYVGFAREFVEELVENLPDNSGKNIQSAELLGVADSTSVTSIILTEKSCDTLPDLLQPESVYKKQTDTDTDTSHTTEYESAVETDVQDSSSINDGLISDEIFDAAENTVNQQHKCDQGGEVVNPREVHIEQSGDVVSEVVNLDGSLETVPCELVAENSAQGNILMPLEVCIKSDILSDLVKAEESTYIATTLSQGDISVLCTGIANLDLDTSAESTCNSVLNDVEISLSGIVADSSLGNSELDTIHLVETEEHELSVLVFDKTGDTHATSELKNLFVDADQLIYNTEYNPDHPLTSQNCSTFQADNEVTALLCLPGGSEIEKELESLPYGSSQNSVHETYEAAKLPEFESIEEFVKRCPEELSPVAEALKKKDDCIKDPVVCLPSCKEENLFVEVNDEHCVQKLNFSLEAIDTQIQSVNLNPAIDIDVNLTCGVSSASPAVIDLNFAVDEFKDSFVEETSVSCNSSKEPIDQICTPIKADGKFCVEKISPISQQDDVNLTSGISGASSASIDSSAVQDFNVGVVKFKDSFVEETSVSCNSSKELIEEVDSHIKEEGKICVDKISPTSQEDYVKLTSGISAASSAIQDFNLGVDKLKDSYVEETNISCSPRKEHIDQVHSPIKEDGKICIEKISPTSQQGNQPITNVSCEFKESFIKDLNFAEALKEPFAEVAKHIFEPVNEGSVEGSKLVLESKKVTGIEAVFSSGATNKTDILVVESQVDNTTDPHPSQSHSVSSQEQEGSTSLALQDVDLCESSAETNSQVPLDFIKDSKSSLCDLVDKVVIVEPSLCHTDQLGKSNQKTLVALAVIEDQKIPVTTPKSATANLSPISHLTLVHTNEDSEQAKKENTVNITQVTPSGISLDFDDLAAEAVNVSNDFLTASQEVGELDFMRGSETTVLQTQTVTMTDTGATQKSDEHGGSLPLDVKWLADSQNKSHNNRNSNVSSVKLTDASSRLKTDSRNSVIDCANEDPFKRRSLLQNSPPRDVSHTYDNKCTMPIKMEKGTGESAEIKENHSEAGPDTAEALSIPGEEIFKDPSDFEFLSSMSSTQPLRDYRKESLYVKFDPLVGSNPIARTDKNIPLPPVSQETISSGDTGLHNEVSVSPKHTTPVKNPALDLVDRLISLSPSPKKPESPKPPPVVKQEPVDIQHSTQQQAAMNEELHVLRELLDQQDKAHQKQLLSHKAEVETLKNKLNITQQRYQEAEEREQKLNKKILDKAQGQKQMSMIMEEYEKTISRLVAEKEAEHQAHELDKETLNKERDLAMGHLTNIEIAFSDVHLKYERSKSVIEGFKKNEEVLRASLAEFESSLHKQEQKYEMLKSHAMQQLEGANQELEIVRRSQLAENAKLKAMLKKSELKTSSLEEMLDQKVKENQELASICDDLISKVGN